MIYIYNDYAGTHTTSLAAAFHLNKIPSNRILTKEEILNVDYFNKLSKSDMGKIIFHGIDENGDSVYTIGRKSSKLIIPALKELSLLLQKEYNGVEKVVFSNTSPTVPVLMSIGGFLAKGLNLNKVGLPFLIIGAKQSYYDILRLVEHTKRSSKSTDSKVIILENKEFK